MKEKDMLTYGTYLANAPALGMAGLGYLANPVTAFAGIVTKVLNTVGGPKANSVANIVRGAFMAYSVLDLAVNNGGMGESIVDAATLVV